MQNSFLSIADALLTSLVNEGAGFHPVVDSIMVVVSFGVIPVMILAVAAQWWSREERSASRYTAIVAWLSFTLGLALNQLVLLFVDRTRPYEAFVSHLLIAPSADPSFPSDHATAAFAIAFAYLLLGWSKSGSAFLAFAFLVGLSRVYIGIHYVGDILGGMATGLLAVLIVVFAYRQNSFLNRKLTALF